MILTNDNLLSFVPGLIESYPNNFYLQKEHLYFKPHKNCEASWNLNNLTPEALKESIQELDLTVIITPDGDQYEVIIKQENQILAIEYHPHQLIAIAKAYLEYLYLP